MTKDGKLSCGCTDAAGCTCIPLTVDAVSSFASLDPKTRSGLIAAVGQPGATAAPPASSLTAEHPSDVIHAAFVEATQKATNTQKIRYAQKIEKSVAEHEQDKVGEVDEQRKLAAQQPGASTTDGETEAQKLQRYVREGKILPVSPHEG